MKPHHYKIVGVVLFAGIAMFLAFNKHSQSGYFNYHSEIWADKAGYYVYLPALKYNFDPRQFPESIEIKTGRGFKLDKEGQKVLTKYTCGVALMQLPFFLLADGLAEPLGQPADGFSPIYHWSVNIAAVCYLVLGMVFLWGFLRFQFKEWVSITIPLLVLAGTNLYYYAIDETGMSHVYSFSLFCAYLYFLRKTDFLSNSSIKNGVMLGLLAGLIVLIRPTNLLFLLCFFVLDAPDIGVVLSRVKRLFKPGLIVPALAVSFLVLLPQLLYWNYASGSFINYSYGNEGFNWGSPQFFNTWFAPNNGLFLYSPFYLLCIVASAWMIKNKNPNGLLAFILFFVVSYVLASWWQWDFGCSFGGRSFIEYLAIWSLPLAYVGQHFKKLSKTIQITSVVLAMLFVSFNLKMTYSYDQCYFGSSDWDWAYYWDLVVSPTR